MAELTPKDMATKLLAGQFERSGPTTEALSDPIADTPMTVTLDQLLPYDLNPRVTRNPRYDEIKSSIRERGLDTPPAITRRPGEPHYIIRNGGNTRLAILHELWSETKDERFFRIPCLFRPWPERGEIIALTGHLAENELHGGLSFIERALGVEKARELYELEIGHTLTQTELARRLTADGYPVTQPHISRMQDAVCYLLPAIPTVLYGGLGRPKIERLAALRKAGSRIWETRSSGRHLAVDFPTLFQDVLTSFDDGVDGFSVKRVQDELIGQMAELLDANYDTLTLEITESESRQSILTKESVQPNSGRAEPSALPISIPSSPAETPRSSPASAEADHSPATSPTKIPENTPAASEPSDSKDNHEVTEPPDNEKNKRLDDHIVTPAPTTDRLQTIQRLVADHMGDTLQDFGVNVLKAIPVQAGGLYPISDVWYIEPGLDTPDSLRVHIAQFAREIADEADQADRVESVADGIGFTCNTNGYSTDSHTMPLIGRAVLTLLHALSTGYQPVPEVTDTLDNPRLMDTLGPLLQGRKHGINVQVPRLSDNSLVKLFRLLRLARRLLELESNDATGTGAQSGP